MTSTVLVEQKKRRKKNAQTSIEEIFNWALKELYKTAELFQKRKKQVILETARRLEEAGVEPSTISHEIVKGLKGFVDDSYVQKVLKDYPQYKDQHQSKRAKSGRNIPAHYAQTERSLPQKQLEQKQEGRPGKWNQNPLEYDIDKLDQYDIEYLHLVVKALHKLRMDFIQEAFQWQARFDEMQKENKRFQGTWNIKPEEYRLQHLDEYGKDLLMKIVKMLHKQKESLMTTYAKWDAQVENLGRENKALKEEIAELKKKLGQSIT